MLSVGIDESGATKINSGRKMDSQSLSPIDPVTNGGVPLGGTIVAGGDAFVRLLEPECLLPVQYNAMVRKRAATDQGESRLLLAVLKDALRSYLRNMSGRTARERREFEEISDWFYAENQEGIFACEHLCDALGIHPEPLRRWLQSLHDDDHSQIYRRRLHAIRPAWRA
jgi:hypothetical protein